MLTKSLRLTLALCALPLPAAAADHRFLAFGDSITFGLGDTGLNCSQPETGGYPPRLRSRLRDSGIDAEMLNFGLCGEKTAQGVTRIETALAAGGDVIVIMEGTNDVSTSVSSETILFNLDVMAGKAEAAGIVPLMASVVPRGPGATRDSSNNKTRSLAEELRERSATANRVFADPFHALFDRNNFFERFYYNDLHPNPSGYGIIADSMLAPAIEAVERGAAITGRVTDALTGEPISFVLVEAVHSDTAQGGGSDFTDADGRFAINGLEEGDHFVYTFSQSRFQDELYDDLPCPLGSCDVTAGTPVPVSFGTTTAGIDFELALLACSPSETALCLNNGRFRVETMWGDDKGQSGLGQGTLLTDDTGYFWFFDPLNVELVVKVLDGCFDPFDTFWVFAGGLTDVEVEMAVIDTFTGDFRLYSNALGSAFAPIQDVDAFATCEVSGQAAGVDPLSAAAGEVERLLDELAGRRDANGLRSDVSAQPTASARLAAPSARPTPLGGDTRGDTASNRLPPAVKSPGACVPDASTLCLNEGRFAVTAAWETDERAGEGQALLLTGDTGYFWFFSPENVEAVIKVLNACELEGFNNFWVFAAGLTDVKVTLRVTDTETLEVQEWVNPLDTAFQPISETGAFMTCP